MRQLFFIIVFMLGLGCKAQNLPVLSTTSLANPDDDINISVNGNYAKDTNNERDQYVGLWQYNQNGILFQLKIEKADKVINKIEDKYSYCDKIVLRYKLIKNGVTIHDNLNQATVDYVTTWGLKQSSKNDLRGRILDYTRNLVGSYTVTKLSGLPAKINFNLVLGDYRLLNPHSYYQDGQPLFSIPTGGIEMVKIN